MIEWRKEGREHKSPTRTRLLGHSEEWEPPNNNFDNPGGRLMLWQGTPFIRPTPLPQMRWSNYCMLNGHLVNGAYNDVFRVICIKCALVPLQASTHKLALSGSRSTRPPSRLRGRRVTPLTTCPGFPAQLMKSALWLIRSVMWRSRGPEQRSEKMNFETFPLVSRGGIYSTFLWLFPYDR